MFPISGPTFLLVYLSLFATALLAHRLLRHHLRRRASPLVPAELSISDLSPEHVGYLLDGPRRARAARSAAGRLGAALPSTDVEHFLSSRGLVVDARQLATLRLWGVAIFGGLLAAGAARAFIGLDRGKPIGLLLVLMMGVAFRLVVVLRARSLRTRAGDVLVDQLKERYESGLGDTSSPMGYALYGWVALSADPAMQTHLRSQGYSSPSSGGCGTGTSGCSSGSSGCSGGGGCGGCGGGCGGS
jgi:uncharacterized membrane protein YgcG